MCRGVGRLRTKVLELSSFDKKVTIYSWHLSGWVGAEVSLLLTAAVNPEGVWVSAYMSVPVSKCCISVCVCVSVCICVVYVSVCRSVYLCGSVCLCGVNMYLWVFICTCVCLWCVLYVCVYVCVCVCVCVCGYLYVSLCVYICVCACRCVYVLCPRACVWVCLCTCVCLCRAIRENSLAQTPQFHPLELSSLTGEESPSQMCSVPFHILGKGKYENVKLYS